MTDTERFLYETLLDVHDFLTRGRVSVRSFGVISGRVRDALRYMENLKYGCPKGVHSASCHCKAV